MIKVAQGNNAFCYHRGSLIRCAPCWELHFAALKLAADPAKCTRSDEGWLTAVIVLFPHSAMQLINGRAVEGSDKSAQCTGCVRTWGLVFWGCTKQDVVKSTITVQANIFNLESCSFECFITNISYLQWLKNYDLIQLSIWGLIAFLIAFFSIAKAWTGSLQSRAFSTELPYLCKPPVGLKMFKWNVAELIMFTVHARLYILKQFVLVLVCVKPMFIFLCTFIANY